MIRVSRWRYEFLSISCRFALSALANSYYSNHVSDTTVGYEDVKSVYGFRLKFSYLIHKVKADDIRTYADCKPVYARQSQLSSVEWAVGLKGIYRVFVTTEQIVFKGPSVIASHSCFEHYTFCLNRDN